MTISTLLFQIQEEMKEGQGNCEVYTQHFAPSTYHCTHGLSPDPILNEYLDTTRGLGGVYNSKNLSLYSYVHLNPVNLIDPDGNATVGELIEGGWESAAEEGNFVGSSLLIVADAIWDVFGFENVSRLSYGHKDTATKVMAIVEIATMGKGSGGSILAKKVLGKLFPKLEKAEVRMIFEVVENRLRMTREVMSGKGKVIAGAGHKKGKILNQAGRLSKQYGGNPEDWSKVTSHHKINPISGKKEQIHSYQNEKLKMYGVEKKLKE